MSYDIPITGLLIALHLDHGLAPVRPAVRADPVSNAVFAAAFAAHKMLQRQRVVRATPVPAADGMFTFWQRAHAKTPLKLVGP